MENKRPKKRTQRGSSHDDSSEPQKTGQRGRPRLLDTDANQKERRRAQIRVAQRSYRERKESTISSLNRQVSDLQSTVADMNSTFAELERRIKEGDSQPDLMRQLEQTSSRMTALATRAKVETSTEEETEEASPLLDTILGARKAPESPAPSQQRSGSTVMGQPWGYHTGEPSQQGATDTGTDTDLMQRISSTDWSTHTPGHQNQGGQIGGAFEQRQHSQTQYSPATYPASNQNFSAQQSLTFDEAPSYATQYTTHQSQDWNSGQSRRMRPRPTFDPGADPGVDAVLNHLVASRPAELPLHSGQNYKEVSFTRRLMRSSLEASINFLKDPRSNPLDVDYFCRYAYCFMKRHNLQHVFQQVYQRPPGQNLELWRVPMFHVGGAGLHYPRDGIDAGARPPDQWAESGLMGPMPDWRPHYPNAHQLSRDQQVEFANVTGEWFDSNDVEAYLRTKGLYLDASTRVVDLNEPADTTVPPLMHSNSVSTQESSTGPASPEPLMPLPEPAFSQAAMAQANSWWQHDPQHVLDPNIMNPLLDFGNDFESEQLNFGAPPMQSKAKKVVDVEAFLDGKLASTLCRSRETIKLM